VFPGYAGTRRISGSRRTNPRTRRCTAATKTKRKRISISYRS
ncbi:3-ketosteroid-delta-1-dehydrogenase, partial [Escherichia coli]|nr:3-ketosteroid-delta-1-dehydrogenase [Escherichia coli]